MNITSSVIVIPVSGKNNGSSKGIIDAIELIQHSPSWTSQDQRSMELWPGKYLDWLLNSDFGKKESQAINNNLGSWYDIQT